VLSAVLGSTDQGEVSTQTAQTSDRVGQGEVSDQSAQVSNQLDQDSTQTAQVSDQVPQVSKQDVGEDGTDAILGQGTSPRPVPNTVVLAPFKVMDPAGSNSKPDAGDATVSPNGWDEAEKHDEVEASTKQAADLANGFNHGMPSEIVGVANHVINGRTTDGILVIDTSGVVSPSGGSNMLPWHRG